jgi:CheY-like chemotaxis protein
MQGSAGKKKLLIVDDVELFIQLQIAHLGHKRFDIHTASSGSMGLEAARALKPDLILLDLLMPDMTGDKVCRILKGDPETSSIPVVIVSSGTREHSRSIIELSGCDGLLFKPVRRDLLLAVVENLLKTNTRLFKRVDVSIPCTVTLDEKKHSGIIHCLSSTGAFVEIRHPVIRGDLLELKFSLSETDSPVKVRAGAVVWHGSLRENRPAGAGVEFLTISAESRNKIEELVRSRMDAGLMVGDEAG